MNPDFAIKALQLAEKRESTSFGELLSAVGKKPSDEFGFKDWCEIVNTLAENKLGLAPNCLLFREYPAADSPVFFYQITDQHHALPHIKNPVFLMGISILHIGSYILSAGGCDSQSTEEKILEVVKAVENPEMKYSETDYAGFRSNIDYLVRKPIDEKLMRVLLESSNEIVIETIRGTALLFLRTLDVQDPKSESITRKVIEIFELNELL